MELSIVDNFLPKDEFQLIRNKVIFDGMFPWYLQEGVAFESESSRGCIWNWYATHTVYDKGKQMSDSYDPLRQIFFDRLRVKDIIRVKFNMYPSTEIVKEHSQHIDYDWSHVAAIYCLNTCDGFTRLEDGTIVESVENRLYTFDGSKLHNSTTTTNSKARFNINFNFTR